MFAAVQVYIPTRTCIVLAKVSDRTADVPPSKTTVSKETTATTTEAVPAVSKPLVK